MLIEIALETWYIFNLHTYWTYNKEVSTVFNLTVLNETNDEGAPPDRTFRFAKYIAYQKIR